MQKPHKALLLLKKVPKGMVVSYKELARACKTSPRAIGRIMASNKEPDKYPCYKVVHANGDVGYYSGNGGVKRKIELLRSDGIEIKGRNIDRKYFRKFT